MSGVLQFVAAPGSLLSGLIAGGAIVATAQRYSLRGLHSRPFIGRAARVPGAPAHLHVDVEQVETHRDVERLDAAQELRQAGKRGGRIPLPASVATLTPDDEPALLAANAFVDHLAGLSRAQWLAIGHHLMHTPDALAHRSTSWAIVDATIAHRRLVLAAWRVRDAVDTVAYLASHGGPTLSRRGHRCFAAAHGAAECAALAVLARADVPGEDVAVLCAPFARGGPGGKHA